MDPTNSNQRPVLGNITNLPLKHLEYTTNKSNEKINVSIKLLKQACTMVSVAYKVFQNDIDKNKAIFRPISQNNINNYLELKSLKESIHAQNYFVCEANKEFRNILLIIKNKDTSINQGINTINYLLNEKYNSIIELHKTSLDIYNKSLIKYKKASIQFNFVKIPDEIKQIVLHIQSIEFDIKREEVKFDKIYNKIDETIRAIDAFELKPLKKHYNSDYIIRLNQYLSTLIGEQSKIQDLFHEEIGEIRTSLSYGEISYIAENNYENIYKLFNQATKLNNKVLEHYYFITNKLVNSIKQHDNSQPDLATDKAKPAGP